MRQFARSLPVVAVAAIAVFAAVATLKSQDDVPAQPNAKSQSNLPAQPETWEYATVLGNSTGRIGGDGFQPMSSGAAYICFTASGGCRYEAVETNNDLNLPTSSITTIVARNYNQALAKAAAQLGSEGWELTNTVAVGKDTSTIQMYFRRPLRQR